MVDGGLIAVIVSFLVLLLLIFAGVPIAFAMLTAGLSGLFYMLGLEPALRVIISGMHEGLASFLLTAAPFFILMGTFAYEAGVSKGAFDSAATIMGRIPGGLAIATLFTCAGFAAVSGNATATAAAVGKVCLPEMERHKYSNGLAAACVATGGTVGILIPPSVVIIILSQLVGLPVGKTLIAGIFPGLLVILLYITTVLIIAKWKPHLMPPGQASTLIEKIKSLKGILGLSFIFLIIIGGIYGGVFTPTEAAAVSMMVTLGMLVIRKRAFGLREIWKRLVAAILDCIAITSMLFLLVISVKTFILFLTLSGTHKLLTSSLLQLQISPFLLVILILAIHIPLGMFLEGLSMSLLTIPIFFPVIQSLGFPGILFLILMVRVVEIGAVTPPVGVNCYVIKGVVPHVPLKDIFRGIMPFLVADVVSIVLLIAFPQITSFLPNKMS